MEGHARQGVAADGPMGSIGKVDWRSAAGYDLIVKCGKFPTAGTYGIRKG